MEKLPSVKRFEALVKAPIVDTREFHAVLGALLDEGAPPEYYEFMSDVLQGDELNAFTRELMANDQTCLLDHMNRDMLLEKGEPYQVPIQTLLERWPQKGQAVVETLLQECRRKVLRRKE